MLTRGFAQSEKKKRKKITCRRPLEKQTKDFLDMRLVANLSISFNIEFVTYFMPFQQQSIKRLR